MTFIIGWIIGTIIASFTIIPILVILAFALPTTKKLYHRGIINSGEKIYKRYVISMILLSIVFIAALLVSTWFSFGGFLFGSFIALFFSLGKWGPTKDNITDYLQMNKEYVKDGVHLNDVALSILN